MRYLALALTGILVAACSAEPQVTRSQAPPITLPAAKSFGAAPAPSTRRGNASLARDFMALAFTLESGRELPVLSRFEGPITIRLTGKRVSSVSSRDLDNLVARLRSEAAIDIRRVSASESAGLTVEVVDGAALRRNVPRAACFVAPNVSDWSEFLRLRNTPALDWTQLRERRRMAVFVPHDVSPQEIRDCLHEEVAQALGPVNDLYHLEDSVFNDDNFHTVLTGFDMAVLRVFYDPNLSSGMSRDAVAERLGAVLIRQRPGFGSAGRAPPVFTPESWKSTIETALGSGVRPGGRIGAARRAVAIARELGWRDNRLGFALYAYGRLTLGQNPASALAALSEAEQIYRSSPETTIHAAHVSVQSAAYALSAGRPQVAIDIVDANSAIALSAQNAGLLSSLLLIKSVALEQMSRNAEARIVERDALGWARYAFASQAEIAERVQEIRRLATRSNGGTG